MIPYGNELILKDGKTVNLIHGIEPVVKDGVYRMVVENPRGVSGKYEIHKEYGIVGMDRVLAAPMPFPFEYGIVPRTWSEHDDDPLDIMVVLPISTFPGCLLEVRVVGLYKMVDTGKEDHKVLAVAQGDDTFQDVREIDDVPRHYLKRIEFFWENYKELSPRKETEGKGWASRAEAEKFIAGGMEYYTEKFGGTHG
jgi:inorganic pyrophosphatase